MYKLKKRKNKGIPRSNKDIPKRCEVNNIAGISPIRALIKAVKTREIIISLTVIYVIFAILFAYVFRTHPTKIEKKK